MTWMTESRELKLADHAGQPGLYEVLCSGPVHDPCDAGLEWKTPARVDRLKITYASLFGRIYEPALAGQVAEYWDGTAWQNLHASVHIDATKRAEFAAVQQFGSVTWLYDFKPVVTTRVRVRLFQPENPDSGHRCYAVRQIEAEFAGAELPKEEAAMPPGLSNLWALRPQRQSGSVTVIISQRPTPVL